MIMKAAIRNSYVDFDDIRIEDVDMPVPKDDELLIKVMATTVNRTDCAIVTGKPFVMRFFIGLFTPKSPIIGTDFAGEVVAVGKNVSSFVVKDRVMGFNDEGANSQAQYVTRKESSALDHIPSSLSYEEAAACQEATHYAYCWIKNHSFNSNQHILLNGASGAIGSALLQYLKYYGVEVTAVTNTKNVDRIKALGADRVIDYLKEDFTTLGGQYDYVADAVGKSRFSKCKPLLKPGGFYLSSELGPRAENIFLALRSKLFGSKKVLFPLPSDIKSSISFVKQLVEKGKYQPVIDKYYDLDDISKAYAYVASGQKTGHVVLRTQA